LRLLVCVPQQKRDHDRLRSAEFATSSGPDNFSFSLRFDVLENPFRSDWPLLNERQ
jgi:hypothetical protein